MRATTATMLSFLISLVAVPAGGTAAAGPQSTDTKAEAPQEAPAPPGLKIQLVPTTAAKPAQAADEHFTPPDGWLPKKQGKYTVYCRKDYNVRGTRFPAMTCYDEKGIREMVTQERIDRERYDQMRKVCGNDSVCGNH